MWQTKSSETPTYSFVIPVFNEAETLDLLYWRLTAVLAGLDGPAEIIIVDDGSTDGTYELASSIASRDQRFKVLQFSRNFGHQAAITAGLDVAAGAAIVIMDGDLQDPPEVVPDMISRWREGFDIVYGIRKNREGESRLKRSSAKLFYRVLGRMSKVEMPFDVGDFRLVDRRALDVVRSMREGNRYLRGMFSWVGFKQTGIEYVRERRARGTSKYSVGKMLTLAGNALAGFSVAPLRLTLVPGLVLVVMSFLSGTVAVAAASLGSFIVPQWFPLIATACFLGGIQLIVLGVLSGYLARIYDEVKQRPLYVVRNVQGMERGVHVEDVEYSSNELPR
jgi:glycosyltransferase involved in cell wall biosynthesis